MAYMGQWPAKHKKQMGTVIVTSTSVIHEAADVQIPIIMCLRWVSAKEGPPPKLPLVQIVLNNEKKRTFELTTWDDLRQFCTALGGSKRAAQAAAAGHAPDAASRPALVSPHPGAPHSAPFLSAPSSALLVAPTSSSFTPASSSSAPAPSLAPASALLVPAYLSVTPPSNPHTPRGSATKDVSVSAGSREGQIDYLKPMARVLAERPKMKKLYDALVPETLTTEAFFEAFQEQLALSQTQKEPQLVRHKAATPIKLSNDLGDAAIKLSKEDANAVFQEHPNIKKVFLDVVEEAGTMTASQFFVRFFRSNYYLKCEGKQPIGPPDVLFDSIPPPEKVKLEMPKVFTQWDTTKRNANLLEKESLLQKLNRISAEPLETLPKFIPDALLPAKRPPDARIELRPAKVFKSKPSTEQAYVRHNPRFMELSSRRPAIVPEAREFQRSMRRFLRAETKRLHVEVAKNPVLMDDFDAIEALLAHYYQSDNDSVKAKLTERLATFSPPASLLRAVRKIINCS
eukprot:GEMP01040728.1.p1 GENE.GEMP01040728.1~~GEMP01040728.1.p1  ORF type:complete len:513 (+),score=131.25 GEMP01040728.1:46-1584(+)